MADDPFIEAHEMERRSDDRKPACAFCGAPSGYPPAGPCPEHPVIPVSESTTERSEHAE